MPVVSNYTAILAINDSPSNRWNAVTDLGTPVIVTYSFADGANVPTVSESSYTVYGTSALTAAQRENFRDGTKVFEAAAGLVFVEVDEGGMIDVSNAHGSSWGGWADYPWSTTYSTSHSTLVIDNSGNYDEGTWGFGTILHEIGHATGLQHPFGGSVTLNSYYDNDFYTMMTYNASSIRPAVLGSFDKEALQYMYGKAVDTTAWTLAYDNKNQVLKVDGAGRSDVIMGAAGDNSINGRQGHDVLFGREDTDILKGALGNDLLIGMDGNDRLFGGNGNDKLFGDYQSADPYGGGNDRLFGGSGNDTLVGGDGDDLLKGGRGRDILEGDDGADRLVGGRNNDQLSGGRNNDVLLGGHGRDTLDGGYSNDTLDGGKGHDRLTGGQGWDVFLFHNKSGRDRILDFENGIDRIDLSRLDVEFSDLLFSARNGGADTVVKISGTKASMYIEDITISELSAHDFLF